MEQLNELHGSICKHGYLMNCSESKLLNCVSMHHPSNPVSLRNLTRFLDEATRELKQPFTLNFGCLSGNIIVSVNLRSQSSSTFQKLSSSLNKKTKRGYDDSYERARDAVDAARKRLQRANITSIDNTHLEYAQTVIENMFQNIQGTNGELVFESLGLSVTPANVITTNTIRTDPSKHTSTCFTTSNTCAPTPSSAPPAASVTPSSTSNFSTRPQLIIACRISGGIAIPVSCIKHMLSQDGIVFDGMITSKVESIGQEYRLPLSHLGKEAESKGQQSMLLFVAVPYPASLPKQASNSRKDEDDATDRPGKARRM